MSDQSEAGWDATFLDSLLEGVFPERLEDVAPPDEGLREKKKRLTRQFISDTATGMFLERGFDAVRVAEVAAACQVSEKTVYNYFPTKESLILDREEAMTLAVTRALQPSGDVSLVSSFVALMRDEITRLYDFWNANPNHDFDLTLIRRFTDLVESTPSLRAAQHDMMVRIIDVAARCLAERIGLFPDAPEAWVAANALVGLWHVQFHAMRRYSDGSRNAVEVRDLVFADVERAAKVVELGLRSLTLLAEESTPR